MHPNHRGWEVAGNVFARSQVRTSAAMKNDAKPKPLRVVLLDSHQKPIVGPACTWDTCDHGAAGFRVKGRQLMLTWADKGKAWKPVEDVK